MLRIFILLFLLPVIGSAQRVKYDKLEGMGTTGELHGHAFKINLPSIPLQTLSIQAEKFMPKKKAWLLGLRWTPGRKLPFYNQYASAFAGEPELSDAFNKLRVSTFSIKPEWRKYFGREVGRGFYIGALGNYVQANLSVPITFTKFDGSLVDVTLKGLNRYGGLGYSLGAQFKAGRRWLIDWWIMGTTIGSNSIYLGAKSADFGIAQDDLDDFNEAYSFLDSLGGQQILGNFKITANNNEISIKQSSFFGWTRAGLCVGYRLW